MESRNLPVPIETSREIKELSRRIEQWRSDLLRGRRIPEPLWASAVQLAKHYGDMPDSTLFMPGLLLPQRTHAMRGKDSGP